MPENITGAEQVQQKKIIVGHPNVTPQKRRRRSRKKKGTVKKYFEWFLWALVIGFFIVTFAMLVIEGTKKDNPFKDKKGASIESYKNINTLT